MDSSKVVVQKINISARYLDRSRAVAEDALEAEDVATVRQEGAREGVPQDVGRTSALDACSTCQAMHELMDATSGKARAVMSDKQGRAGDRARPSR